ncbi:MAG: Gfo/Idh/MocA family oxidoreductase [Microscillaceae bacterium]|nr:Gfo/Idh/MocA family oxidoreductase [Microscillaceae bacterium]
MNRRTFLEKTGNTALGLSALPLLSAISFEPKYRLALIGCGWWGMNICREALAEGSSKLIAICDVDQRTLKTVQEEINQLSGQKPKPYTDYREMLTKEKPEIVIVATPDHWHALPALMAMELGAHVYIEKPIGHTINEGKALLQVARKYDRVAQVGFHRRVSAHHLSAMEFLKSGKAGHVSSVKAFVNYGGGPGKPEPEEKIPEGLDWDMWCGPAPYRPYHAGIHPRGFRNYLDYANGTIADWGIHWFDQILWWTEERYPKTIFSSGGKFVKKDNTDAPDTQLAIYEFESFVLQWESKLATMNANENTLVGCYFYGTEGTLHLGFQDGWTFYPSKKDKEKIHFDSKLNQPDDQNIKELWADLLQAIQQKRRPTADIEHGYLATNISLLGVISYKLGRSLRWDGEKGQILDDPEANALLSREYRKPWEYPKF